MQIVLDHRGQELELDLVTERPDSSVADLLGAAVDGAGPDLGLLIDGRWYGPELGIDETPLYEGARVRVSLRPTAPSDEASAEAGLVLAVIGGPAAGTAVPLSRSVLVGRGPHCDLSLPDPSLSFDHARFDVLRDGGIVVTDLGSTNGTYIHGQPLTSRTEIEPGSVVQVGATEICVREHARDDRPLAVDPANRAAGGLVPFNRPPRPALPAGPAELELPPPAPNDEIAKPPFRLLAVLAPLGMAAVMVQIYGSLRFAMFGLLSPVMAIGNWISARRKAGRDHKGMDRKHREGLQRLERELAEAAAAERARRDVLFPDPAEVLRRALLPSVRLWERRRDHADFLRLRVGTGEAPWKIPVAVGPGGTRPSEVEAVIDRHRRLPQAAIDVNLTAGPVGIVGDRGAALALARSLVVQAAVHHGPADLGTVVLAAGEHTRDWDWTKWLPHSRRADGTGRLLAGDRDTADALVTSLLPDVDDDPLRRRPPGLERTAAGPTRLYVVDDLTLLEGRKAPLRKLLRGDGGPASGIVIAPTEDRLPALCTTVIHMAGGTGEATLRQPGVGLRIDGVNLSGVTEPTARHCARTLARYEDPEQDATGAGMPDLVRLLPLLGIETPDPEAIAEDWRRLGPDPAPIAPIGLDADGPVWLDLVADGPHGLIGGTTGSGKSELLRSMVAGMAAVTDPDHLVFVLVDYKGGSAFDDCARLPHVVGMVTDLDEHLGERALRSLEAELTHRERLLREAGTPDLPAYLQAGAPLGPLPRLAVVVDEFATLATELPDFLGALVGVAQRGRSLGVHLILATQRPQGAVNANIKANTNLRIALRVQDAADSQDIIERPDAAAIPRSTPGRAFVRRGPGEVEAVQTALSTMAPGEGSAHGVRTAPFHFGPAGAATPVTASGGAMSDLTLLVDAVIGAHRLSGAAAPRRPWLEMLGDQVDLDDLAVEHDDAPLGAGATIPFALADDPDNQRRVPVGWVPADGHLALYGMAGSGTTTAAVSALLSLCRQVGPNHAHVYGVDFGSGGLSALAGLPHAGAVVGANQREAQVRLVRMLRRELDRRRDLAMEALAAEPLLVCAIDGVGAFLAEYEGLEGTEVTDAFRRLIADGPGARILFVLTGERVGALPLRFASSISQRVLFRLAEVNEYSTVGLRPKQVPAFVPGRCVHGPSGLVAQVARPADVPAAVAAVAAATGEVVRPPRRVGTLPREVALADLPTPAAAESLVLPLAIAEDELEPAALVLHPGDHALVAGPPRSGVTDTLALIAHQVRQADPDAVIAAVCSPSSSLGRVADLDAYGPLDELGPVLLKGVKHPRRWVVLVDDATLVEDPTGVLPKLLAARRPHLHVIGGGRVDDLRRTFNHWSRDLRASRTGVLLDPNLATDGDLFGARLPRRIAVDLGPGRGFIMSAGRPDLVQLAQIAQPVTTTA